MLPRIIDSTIILDYRDCERKFHNSHDLKRGLRGPVNIHLGAGGAFASGIEEYRLAHYVDKCGIEECRARMRIAASIAWGDSDPFPPDHNLEHLIHAKSLDRIMTSIEAYFTRFDPRFDRLQPVAQHREGHASFEYNFTVPLDGFPEHPEGGPFIYSCRADTLGTYDKIPVFSDEKTTGAMGKTWAKQWPLRHQFMGYAWCLRALGRPERACLVRGVCILKESTKFAEELLHFNDDLLDQWEESLRHTLDMMLQYNAAQYWPQRFGNACTNFGDCLFKPVCLAPRRIQAAVLDNNYVHREWDPTFRATRPELLKLTRKEPVL